MAPLVVVPLSVRVFRVFESLTFYPLKLVWPSHLSPNYVSDVPLGPWSALASVLTVLIVTAAVVVCQTTHANAGGGLGVVRDAGSSCVRALAEGPASGGGCGTAYVAMLPLLLLVGAAGVWVWRRSTAAARLRWVGLLACELCAFAAGHSSSETGLA